MRFAIAEARKAAAQNEVPVGAVVVKDNKIISKGYNSREQTQNAIAHAEILAIKAACKNLGSWRLSGCTLYVTLEPCLMCIGAAINARLPEIIFGCFAPANLPHKINLKIKGGVLERECADLLIGFFEKKRLLKKEEKTLCNGSNFCPREKML